MGIAINGVDLRASAGDVLLELSGEVNAVNRAAGKTQVKEIAVTSAANAGAVSLTTATSQSVLIKSVVIRSNSATTTDFVSIEITTGVSGVVTLISAASGVFASLDVADKQVIFDGTRHLPSSTAVVATLTGIGATPVDFTVAIEYEACANGGYLS